MDTITQDFKLYKGRAFRADFTLYDDDNNVINPSDLTVQFLAAETPGGAAVISRTNESETNPITVDSGENYLNTLKLTDAETTAITQSGKLHYEINISDSDGYFDRKQMGIIYLFASITEAE